MSIVIKREIASNTSTSLMRTSTTRHPSCIWTAEGEWFKDISDMDVVVGGKTYYLHHAMINHSTELLENGGYRNIGRAMHALRDMPITCAVFEQVVSYMYNGYCEITADNALEVLKLAERLKVTGLTAEAMKVYRRNIDVHHVIEAWTYARANHMYETIDVTLDYILRNIDSVSSTQDFLEMPVAALERILRANRLNLPDEMRVFRLILEWIRYQPGRDQCIRQLITCVRIERIPLTTLVKQVYGNQVVMCDDSAKAWLTAEHEFWTARNFFFNKGVAENLPSELEVSRPRICSDLVVSIGGWHGCSPLNGMECYDDRAGQWYPVSMKKPLPNRAYHGTVVVGDMVYMMGGLDGEHAQLASVLRVDLVNRKWSYVADMLTSRCFASTTLCKGKIYAIGGISENERLRGVERLDLEDMTWNRVAAMNKRRSDACCTTIKGIIYVAGGFTGTVCLKTVEAYDPDTDKWTYMSPMSRVRSGLSMVTNDDQYLYVVGGYDGEHRLSLCERYDTKSNTWVPKADIVHPRSNSAVFVLEGNMYVAGGYNGVSTTDHVERYDPAADEWLIQTSLTVSSSAHKVIVLKQFRCPEDFTYYGHNEKRASARLRYLQLVENIGTKVVRMDADGLDSVKK